MLNEAEDNDFDDIGGWTVYVPCIVTFLILLTAKKFVWDPNIFWVGDATEHHQGFPQRYRNGHRKRKIYNKSMIYLSSSRYSFYTI